MVFRLIPAVCLALLLQGCSSLFFYPMEPWVQNPARQGLAYEDVVLIHPDGLRLERRWRRRRLVRRLRRVGPRRGRLSF